MVGLAGTLMRTAPGTHSLVVKRQMILNEEIETMCV